MKSKSIAELKAHTPRVIRAVQAGESCVVTRRNKPVAKIVPCMSPSNRTQVGFDTKVRIHHDLTLPAIEGDEWGSLAP